MSRQERRTPKGDRATELIVSIFRANGLLLAAGDVLAAEYGLTSARWQVLGAIALRQRPLTVPQIARRMGLTRQSVHESANHLVAEGLLEFAPNADHRRSRLVRMTEQGSAKYQAIDAKQAGWVNRLASGLTRTDLATATRVLEELSAKLEGARSELHEGKEMMTRTKSKPEAAPI